MKLSIATVSISGVLQEKLETIAAAGFDGVEIFENDLIACDQSPREIGAMVRSLGMEVSLYQPFRDFEGLPEPQRANAFRRARGKFEIMNELGADLILVCSTVSPLAVGGLDRAAEDLAELGEVAAEYGVRIGYEALAWGRFISDHRDAWEVVRRAGHPNVGLILDSFHTLSRNIELNSLRSIPGERIFFVQLADAPRLDMNLLQLSRHHRSMPGQGEFPVADFMSAVMATGYAGPISLEIFNDQFRGSSAATIARDGHRSLVALVDRVARREAGRAVKAPSMPDRVKVEGIEFLEFTSDAREVESLTAVLRHLGFRLVGRHIARKLTLWRQGGINIVVNTDEKGFARSAYLLHGTSVCDIGLKVADVQATVERAEALGAQLFSQPREPGELDIPSIRGVDGGLLHFIDEKSGLSHVWEVEFRPVDESDDGAGGSDAGLLAIDHLAQTMRSEEMLTWLLFYTTIFETEKTPVVDVHDPAGIVHSQAVENGEGTFRMTLNGALNRNTLAGYFMSESAGSSVQHIAFATKDIFATAATLRDNGFKPLAMPKNYYADIAVKHGLAPELLARLEENSILYDRDDEGEYFQLYSPLFGSGYFFEIVERRGGYRGYGAANAFVRVAAQHSQMRAPTMPRL